LHELSYQLSSHTLSRRDAISTRNELGIAIPELFPENEASLIPRVNVRGLSSLGGDQPHPRDYVNHTLGSAFTWQLTTHTLKGGGVFGLEHVNSLSRTGEHDRAKRLYERAVTVWERSLGVDHPRVATGLGNLARFYLRTGSYQEPGLLLARALAIQEKALGPDHPDVALTLSSRAELEAHHGTAREAFATAVRAEALGREHLRLTMRSLPERQALSYASSLPSTISLMLRLASIPPGDSQMVTEAWNAVVRARGVVFDEVAARHRSAGADASGIAASATALASARQRLAALVVRGIRNDPPDRYRRLLEEARAAKDRSERALAEHSPTFRDDESRSRLGLRDVAAALPRDSALVAFVRSQDQRLADRDDQTLHSESEPSYLAFVLSAGHSQPVLVPLGSAARIEALILQWRKQLDQEAIAGGTGATRGEAAYRRVAAELRRQVWDPLSAHLRNATRLYVVPDGALTS
jgi:hypothetical protein